jgi:hypothetical protein
MIEVTEILPDPNVTGWIESVDPEAVHLSVITVGELKRGIAKLAATAVHSEYTANMLDSSIIFWIRLFFTQI